MKTRLALAALVALTVSTAEPALAQCSMCRSVVGQSPEGQRIGAQLNAAILVLFCAPYLVFGSVAAVLFRARIARHLAARPRDTEDGLLARLARLLFSPR